jgi:mannose-6-phosphate isomerase-like protein (cupin superfamily)
MSTEPRIFSWSEMPKQTLMNGLFERTALRSDGGLVTLNWFKPNAPKHAQHSHPFDQIALIVTGTLVMVIDGKEHVIGPGSAIYIPKDVPHTGYPQGDEPVLNIDIFAPAREDYLFLAVNQNDWGDVPDVPAGSPFQATKS